MSNGTGGFAFPALLPVTHYLSWVSSTPCLKASLALTPLISWDLQCSSGFQFHNFTQWPLSISCLLRAFLQDFPDTHCLTSMAFLSHWGRLHDPFVCVSFTTLNPYPHGQHWQVRQPAWDGAWSFESYLEHATMPHILMMELNSDSHAYMKNTLPTELFLLPISTGVCILIFWNLTELFISSDK